MISNQQLISDLRILINQISAASDPGVFQRLIDEFLEKYEIWPSLQEIRQSIDSIKKSDFKILNGIEKKACKEIDAVYLHLTSECKNSGLEIPVSFIDAYEQKIRSSLVSTTSKFEALKEILNFMLAKGCISIVKKFAKISSDGWIYEFTFSPSFVKWEQKKESLQKSPWYCFDQLNRFKQTRKRFDEEFPFLGKNDHFMRDMLNVMLLAGDYRINIAEYKSLVQPLYEYTKEMLLSKKQASIESSVFSYKYKDEDDFRGGELTDGKKILELKGNSAELVYELVKENTQPRDEIKELTPNTTTPKKEQINNAIRVVNNGVLTKFLKPKYIKSKNGILSINYPTNLVK